MTTKPTIAGVVLTLNEEQNLVRCLRSLSWCDHLLVLDSGSTDSTMDIALSFGCQFVVHRQSPPFLITDQRNYALLRCGLTTDWVFFLDADEEVGVSLSTQILSTILHGTQSAYELAPRYWFLGRWLRRTQSYPNWHPRLVKRGCNTFSGGVWEHFSDQLDIGRIYIPYEHYAFSKGLDDWLERHQRYSRADARELLAFLRQSHDPSALSPRKRRLRFLSSSLWYIRPLLRFVQKYILNLGFTEGYQSLVFSLLISFYDLMTVIRVIQERRRLSGHDY